MASFRAIAATSSAIIGLLKDACPRSEFLNAEFKLYQASDYETHVAEGISLMLYQVTVNGTLRNLRPRSAPDGTRYRPSLPLDLHYLLTAWSSDAEKQQRLLGWAMRVLEDTPTLPSAILNKYMDVPDTFRPEESVEFICDPLPIQDLAAVWDKLKPKYQTSVAYVVHMITIDSEIKLTEAEIVQTRSFDAGKKVQP